MKILISENLSLLNKQENCSVLHLVPFVTGLYQVKSTIVLLHQEFESMIIKILREFLVAILILRKRKKLLTVELVQKNKWMTLNDKRIFSNPNCLIMSWLQTSLLGLTGKEKVFKPFWTNRCLEISQKLWLPIETDSVDLLLNSSNTSLQKTELNSLSWIEIMENQKIKNSQMTSCPSYMSIHVDKMEKEGIRTRKIRMYPDQKQQMILKEWLGTSRYVYNKSLAAVTKNKEKKNFFELRNKYVSHKKRNGTINTNVENWELKTPKDIRAGAVKDMVNNYNSNFQKLKNRTVKHFKLIYRKKNSNYSIEIPKNIISIEKNKKKKRNKEGNKEENNTFYLHIYKQFITDGIKMSNDKCLKNNNLQMKHDCRLQYLKGKWFLCIPIDIQIDDKKPKYNSSCSLDPGVRKFQTVYSEDITIKIGIKKDMLKKLYKKLDNFQSLRSKKLITKSHYTRRINKTYFQIDNLINDIHYKTIDLLTKNFRTIFLPEFESQELVKKMKFKRCKRDLLCLKHFLFKQRLLQKCELKTFCKTIICTEEYTSKTCSRCGVLNNKLTTEEIFECNDCGLIIDRDINGARNIMIKIVNETLEK